jgi:NAD(P)-dependent dehydrogenase (short-subunit alcohol dehydrogenase family)
MREKGWGRIINLTSVVGQRGIAGTCAYAASKAGIEALTRTIAVENATKGITANCLALGYFETGMINTIPEPLQDKIRGSIPMGRFGTVLELEHAVRFLIDADYVTGATINVNGGLA